MSQKIRFPAPENRFPKLKEALLYIAESCKDDADFGAIKLNKILFIADFFSFSALGHPITEATYFHLPNGPAPKQLLPAQDELFTERRAELIERPYHGRTQKRLVAKKKPNTTVFLKEEKEIIDLAINTTCGKNGTELSDWTHELLPWILTEPREDIPFHTVFTIFDRPVGRAGITWGEKEIGRLMGAGCGSL